MKFVTFEPIEGLARVGFLVADGWIADLEGAFAASLAGEIPQERALALARSMAPPDAQSFIEGGEVSIKAVREALAYVEASIARDIAPTTPMGGAILFQSDEVRLLAPVPRPRKFIAAGKNYFAHQVEMQERSDPNARRNPIAHVQFASTVVGPDATIPYPKETEKLDYEVEIVVVIGKRAFRIEKEDAFRHVFGYTIYNDISARDVYWNKRDEGGGIGMLGKNLPAFSPLGHYLATPDELGDPKSIPLHCRVNGETRQDSTTAIMMFGIDEQIAYWSRISLEPGEVLGTGTPRGVAAGRKPDDPPWWLARGDVIECEVEGLGTLRTTIA